MSLLKKGLVSIIVILLLSGCASIMSQSSWPFSVETLPSGAQISIVNRKGIEVYKGKTPCAMKLKSGSSFFRKETYVISLQKEGYDMKKVTVSCKTNGWYWGNLLFGGLTGMLIIDPATGAMYKLESDGITERLEKAESTNTASLKIIERSQIPKEWEGHLVKIN